MLPVALRSLVSHVQLRPRDADRRIVPGNAPFGSGIVYVRALVGERRLLRKHQEPVGKSRRHPEHLLRLRVQLHGHILPEARRSGPHVHRNVENLSRSDPHQLPLGVGLLEVQPPQHALAGRRFVVLNKGPPDAGGGKFRLLVGLEEIPPAVPVNYRCDQDHVRNSHSLKCKHLTSPRLFLIPFSPSWPES